MTDASSTPPVPARAREVRPGDRFTFHGEQGGDDAAPPRSMTVVRVGSTGQVVCSMELTGHTAPGLIDLTDLLDMVEAGVWRPAEEPAKPEAAGRQPEQVSEDLPEDDLRADALSGQVSGRRGRSRDALAWALLEGLYGHRYEYDRKGAKPDDPGWHCCSCGAWEGYWCDYQPHVAEELAAKVRKLAGGH